MLDYYYALAASMSGADRVSEVSAPVLYEHVIELEQGQNTIIPGTNWNAFTIFDPEGDALPALSYIAATGESESIDLGHNKDITHEEEVHHDEDHRLVWITDMEDFHSTQTILELYSDAEQEVVIHFYNTIDTQNLIAATSGISRPRFVGREEWGGGLFAATTPEVLSKSKVQYFDLDARIDAAQDRYKAKKRGTYQDESEAFAGSSGNSEPRFTIHHTGESKTYTKDSFAHMKAIYLYHAVTRGWGDVAYHYVVSPEGYVFEGRDGGPTKNGFHTYDRNQNNIGVALMGNFNLGNPTPAQLEVLSILIADHALRFGIDPLTKADYFGKDVYKIAGHRDIAKSGHGTACPGVLLHAQIPNIRRKVASFMEELEEHENGNYRFGKSFLIGSKFAPKVLKEKEKYVPDTSDPVALHGMHRAPIISRGDKGEFVITVKNNMKQSWNPGMALEVVQVPAGLVVTKFRAIESIAPGGIGKFKAKYIVQSTNNGTYTLALRPTFFSQITRFQVEQDDIPYEIQVSGKQNYLLSRPENTNTTSQAFLQRRSTLGVYSPVEVGKSLPKETVPEVKVKLAFFEESFVTLTSAYGFDIFGDTKHIVKVAANERVTVKQGIEGNRQVLEITKGTQTWTAQNFSAVTSQDGIIQLVNYDRGLSNTNGYNEFRRRINVHLTGTGGITVVNQLPIELYLRGLAEEPSTEPLEKKHAIHIAARNYALVYSGERRKFRTQQYDLEDDPATSQKYLGYGWEKYHADQVEILEDTIGMVVTVAGKPVILPYHTQSGGQTSAKWKGQYPHTKAQVLPWDKGHPQRGHGVGLSGRSARALAEEGLDYKQILDYFFDGIEIEKLY